MCGCACSARKIRGSAALKACVETCSLSSLVSKMYVETRCLRSLVSTTRNSSQFKRLNHGYPMQQLHLSRPYVSTFVSWWFRKWYLFLTFLLLKLTLGSACNGRLYLPNFLRDKLWAKLSFVWTLCGKTRTRRLLVSNTNRTDVMYLKRAREASEFPLESFNCSSCTYIWGRN